MSDRSPLVETPWLACPDAFASRMLSATPFREQNAMQLTKIPSQTAAERAGRFPGLRIEGNFILRSPLTGNRSCRARQRLPAGEIVFATAKWPDQNPLPFPALPGARDQAL